MEVSALNEAGTAEGSKGLIPGGVKAKSDSVIRQVWSLLYYVGTCLFNFHGLSIKSTLQC